MGRARLKGTLKNRGVKRGGISKGTQRKRVPVLPWRKAEMEEQASKEPAPKSEPTR
ncbi:MAG: hypothetical protein HY684_05490 [Chloroflexi bacterium]|nr:hypothetical protein [Chloroflexota bacterium]